MVIWVQYTRLKLISSYRKLNANFGNFKFFSEGGREDLEFYRLAKFLTPIQTEFFQYLSRLCTYLWGIHNLKNNSAVQRSTYLYGVNWKFSLANAFFLLIKSITRSFMLNTMMKKENKHFANNSIPFLILFIMKWITQITILFCLNWKYFSAIYK